MRVDIFIMTNFRGPSRKDGIGGYVIRTKVKGQDSTVQRAVRIDDGTENMAEIKTALYALRRLNEKATEVHIYPEREYLAMAIEKWSKKWVQNGFTTAKGKPVEYRDWWEEILSMLQNRQVEFHPGQQHEFYNWMKGALDKCQNLKRGSEKPQA